MIHCRAPVEKITENHCIFLKKNYSLKGGGSCWYNASLFTDIQYLSY